MKKVMMAQAEISAGGETGRHTHPGVHRREEKAVSLARAVGALASRLSSLASQRARRIVELRGSSLPAPPPNTSTRNSAISVTSSAQTLWGMGYAFQSTS